MLCRESSLLVQCNAIGSASRCITLAESLKPGTSDLVRWVWSVELEAEILLIEYLLALLVFNGEIRRVGRLVTLQIVLAFAARGYPPLRSDMPTELAQHASCALAAHICQHRVVCRQFVAV